MIPLMPRSLLVAGTILFVFWVNQRLSPLTYVRGSSMEPAIQSGEIVSVSHQIPKEIPRGTIVIIGQFARLPLIKRVVGLPNERVSFRLGEVFVNGKMLYEPYLPESQTTFSWTRDAVVTHENEYVVLGDNRLVSQDSREYGAVSRSQIIGTIDLPCKQAQFLDRARYRILADSPNRNR
jgi:signal peptidase I